MSDNKVHAWVTKYALSRGLFEVDGDVDEQYPKMLSYREKGRYANTVHSGEWYRTKEAAEARVAELVEARKASLRKQLAKLEKFKVKYAKGRR